MQTNDVGTEGMPVKKNEFVIALNRAANTKGGVWVYRRGHKKAVVRRVLKAVPITEDWKQHMNELAKETTAYAKQNILKIRQTERQRIRFCVEIVEKNTNTKST